MKRFSFATRMFGTSLKTMCCRTASTVASISAREKRSRCMIASVISAPTRSCPLKRIRPFSSTDAVGGLPMS